jgi:plastocyanin
VRTHAPIRIALILALALGLVQSLVLAVPLAAQDEPAPAETVEVGSNFYRPDTTEIQVGETVEWTNVGGNHNVTFEDGSFSSGNFNSGSVQRTFDEAGTFAYFCSIHSSPGGTAQNGVVTVAQADGQPPVEEPTEPPADSPPVDEPVEEAPRASGESAPEQVSGDDPVETALAWSSLLADGSTGTVLLGTSGGFADSLASGTLQGSLDAPLLLTDTDALDPRVSAEIERLGATDVVILGGTSAISQDVEDELAATLTVTRAAGTNRIETAIAVAAEAAPDATSVIIARAFGEGSAAFADSLGAGAISAQTGTPVLLTDGAALDAGVAADLQARGVTEAVVAGGVAAISDQVVADLQALDIAVTRLSGLTRNSTAVALQGLADQTQPVTVVEGSGDLAWASGFAAAGFAPGGILLTNDAIVPGDTLRALFFSSTGAVCGPTLDAEICDRILAAAAVDVFDTDQDVLTAVMDDGQEVPPAQGAPDASGVTTVYKAGDAALCFGVELFNMSGPVTVSHVHNAPFGTAGAVTVGFELSPVDGTAFSLACATGIDAQVRDDLFANPEGSYINVHTELNPMGEVRGQLFTQRGERTATLTGASEVPGPGDPDAIGSLRLFQTGIADQFCYVLDQGGLTPAAVAAHIHDGDAQTAGPVVHGLQFGGPVNAACDRGVDPALVADVLANPAEYYVNVHNEPFPMGAIRGQLG